MQFLGVIGLWFLLFSAQKLHHTYLRFNDKNVDNIKRLLDSEGFKGASVTMPSKKDVVPFMSEIYGVAKEIGVVNTIVKTDGKLYGKVTIAINQEITLF